MKLLADVEACVLSAKGSLDAVVMHLKGNEAAIAKSDADLATKQAAAHTQAEGKTDTRHLQPPFSDADRLLILPRSFSLPSGGLISYPARAMYLQNVPHCH
jgi:hypothetical protein